MFSSRAPAHQFLALLAELRNVALENKFIINSKPLFDDIPLDLLLRFHHLFPKATLSALKALDGGITVEALVCADNHPVVVFFVGNHLVLIPGILCDPKRNSLSFVRFVYNNNNRNSCDCAAFAYGGRQFCKHIIAAGLYAALGISLVRHVATSEILGRINKNKKNNNPTARRHMQVEEEHVGPEPTTTMGIDPFSAFVSFDNDF